LYARNYFFFAGAFLAAGFFAGAFFAAGFFVAIEVEKIYRLSIND
jgi:hypothetical protein